MLYQRVHLVTSITAPSMPPPPLTSSYAWQAVLRIWTRIRIRRIHMFIGLLDPDPDPFIIKQNSKKNLDSHCFMTYVSLFIFE
jgi:hypothetical protein